MLWYVEQSVPEPGCQATGNAKCPTVTALMPQVYLPENFSALSAGGQIVASNDLSLNFGSNATGGSVLNTGSITSGGTLTVNTGTLTNRANELDVADSVKSGMIVAFKTRVRRTVLPFHPPSRGSGQDHRRRILQSLGRRASMLPARAARSRMPLDRQ